MCWNFLNQEMFLERYATDLWVVGSNLAQSVFVGYIVPGINPWLYVQGVISALKLSNSSQPHSYFYLLVYIISLEFFF